MPILRTVVLDHIAQVALDSACEEWTGTEIAWLAIEWTLAHDPEAGPLLTDKANVRGFPYHGARSIDQPDMYIVYEVLDHRVIVKVLGFDEAKASYAGNA